MVLLLGERRSSAYGGFVLLPATLSALGIAFTTESMVGLGASSSVPLAAMAGVLPIAAGMAVRRRAEPARRMVAVTAFLYAPIAIWSSK